MIIFLPFQVPKRNYAHAISRGTFKDRGQGYSEKGVMMRCARKDQTTLTVTLHHISTGGATVRFSVRKQAREREREREYHTGNR